MNMEMLSKCGFYCISFILFTLTLQKTECFETTVSYAAEVPNDEVVLKLHHNKEMPLLERHRRAVEKPKPTTNPKSTATPKSTDKLSTASPSSAKKAMTTQPSTSRITGTISTKSEKKTETVATVANPSTISTFSESQATDSSTSTITKSQLTTQGASTASSTSPTASTATLTTTSTSTSTLTTSSPSAREISSTTTPVTTPRTDAVTSTTPYMSTTSAFFNTSTKRDHHQYYISDVHNDPALTRSLLKLFTIKFASGAANHHYLLRSMNHAVKFRSRFTFPFYGHPQNRITLGTGGFVYLSDFLHPYLMHSQYAAPLMAPLHTYRNNSDIRYLDDGNGFWVLWENVFINTKEAAGPFTFQMVIFKNGTIVFAYDKLPILPKDMKDIKPPVRIGISDAYYWDVSIPWSNMRMRKIIRYDTISLPIERIRENTVVILTPLPTCHEQGSCKACLAGRTNFTCSWCPSLGRCSSGTDRYRQEWERHSCHQSSLKTSCTVSTTSSSSSTSTPTSGSVTEDCPSTTPAAASSSGARHESTTKAPVSAGRPHGHAQPNKDVPVSRVVAATLIFILCVSLIAGVVLWCRYAYRNPSSPSGIWLLEHRPSVLKAKFSRVMFWKRHDPAGDRYQVSFASNETFA